MQKILFWFRGDKSAAIADGGGDQGRWPKRWRSSMLARSSRRENNGGEQHQQPAGMSIAHNFDAVTKASTSSPAILPAHNQKTNGHARGGGHRTGGKSERRRDRKEREMEENGQEQQSRKPNSSSTRHHKSSGRKKAAAYATTEDIPDSRSGPGFDVCKKAVSANAEMGGKRPGLLQRIRSRLSTKASSSQQQKERRREKEEAADRAEQQSVQCCEEMLPRLAREELRMERLAMARAIKEEVRGEERRSTRQYERLTDGGNGGGSGGSGRGGGRRAEAVILQQQRSEDLDAFSQGRCSSFDYFSAAASPTDQPMLDREEEEGFDTARTREHHQQQQQPRAEEDLRFATAAEARAYLRRQMAAEAGGEQGEETAFDADDEISNRLTASAAGDSVCQLIRPHSAMSTTGTGRHQQRESIYFTVVQQPTGGIHSPSSGILSMPSSPPDKQHRQQGNSSVRQQQHQAEFELSKHRSKSQMLLAGQGQDSPLAGSEPGSAIMGRRKLRFVIPQVSICSVDGDNCSSVVTAADDEANNNNSGGGGGGGTSRPGIDGISLLSEDSLNNNCLAATSSSSSVAIQAMLPAMLGQCGPEAEQELKRALSQMDRRQLTLAQRRQSNMDVVHQASGRRTSTTLIPLTSAQIHLIRSLWRQVYLSKGPTVIGSQISHRLFFKEPEMREQFRRCPLPQQYVNHDSFSKAHCRQISEMIDHVVESLDDLECVSQMLEQVGRAHARISGGQLSSKLWNAVAETFIDCTLEWGDRRARSETVRKAWALIIAFMIEKIKHGHLEERRQITAIRSTIASLERFAVGGGMQQQPPTGEGGGGNGDYQQQQQQQQQPSQLPVPIGPIRRVSATGTLLNGVPAGSRPVKFSPDQYRTPSSMASSSVAASSIVSPVANRRKPLRFSAKAAASPKAIPRSGRAGSSAERPQQQQQPPVVVGCGRKASAEVEMLGGSSASAAATCPHQQQQRNGPTTTAGLHTDV